MGVGLTYLVVALGICSDNQFVTLTRRELSAYFLTPDGASMLLAVSPLDRLPALPLALEAAGAAMIESPLIVDSTHASPSLALTLRRNYSPGRTPSARQFGWTAFPTRSLV